MAGGTHLFVEFVEATRARVVTCRGLVPKPDGFITIATVDEIFRHVHTIKGEARAFDLPELEDCAHRLENELDTVRDAARADGHPLDGALRERLLAAFDEAVVALDRGCERFASASPIGSAVFDQITVRRTDLEALVAEARGRSGPLGAIVDRLASRPLGESTAMVVDLAHAWAEGEQKEVRIVVEDREKPIPAPLSRALSGVLTHLVRNAVAHGIELPAEREAAGKPRAGTIRIAAGEPPAVLIVEDDGRGVDEDLVRSRAEAGRRHAPAAELIFEPGLTTRATPDLLAGRGVGLDAVRTALAEVGYGVSVARVGERTRFTVHAAESLARVGT
jgi:chemotaxis protein histidine kinase CheA